MPNIDLFVFLLGDSSPSMHMFPITASADISVDALKNRVYAKVQKGLEDVNAKNLILWKVLLQLCSFTSVLTLITS